MSSGEGQEYHFSPNPNFLLRFLRILRFSDLNCSGGFFVWLEFFYFVFRIFGFVMFDFFFGISPLKKVF